MKYCILTSIIDLVPGQYSMRKIVFLTSDDGNGLIIQIASSTVAEVLPDRGYMAQIGFGLWLKSGILRFIGVLWMLKISSKKRGLPGKNQSTIFDKRISRLWIDPP
tara:strand:+ start:5248 stop:5565 length:318 start_codon:yes stop_codon:yes gene_type:complete